MSAADRKISLSGDIQVRLISTLRYAGQRLAEANLPQDLAARMNGLAEEIGRPCTVAVVGRVNSGKSSFINAVLGEDLAKVGVTETTATINYFRYGTKDSEYPITAYWRNGQMTRERMDFLDQLQGQDPDSARRADAIDRLEYHVPSRILERITLIDTPGTGGVVAEHGQRTAAIMGIEQVSLGRDQETRRLAEAADGVIYMVGAPDLSGDADVRQQFLETTGGRSSPLNSIGVLSKIDLDPALVGHRETLDEAVTRIAGLLRENLGTVVPVSAGVRRALDRLCSEDRTGLSHLISMFRRMKPEVIQDALDDYDTYLDPQLECPRPVEERRELLDMASPWMVFTTIARELAGSAGSTDAALARLSEVAGFEGLEAALERHFIKRAHYLRGYRVLTDALRILDEVKFTYAPQVRQRRREEQARAERLLSFIRQAPGDPAIARELEDLVRATLTASADLQPVIDDLERSLGAIFAELEEYNLDMQALQQLEDYKELFDTVERAELLPLLGLWGMDTDSRLPPGKISADYVRQRQQYWYDRQFQAQPVRQQVAMRAVDRYGYILDELDRRKEAALP